ncbi:MAG: hypothetical protein OQK76_05615, partial [Gammaproteobacteria bacterium]|nr:hypothetical protein [Gammaproteobacteria bacterium]
NAEIVFMGGSLVKHGGQNILEPARLSRPIIVGPYFYNFQQEVDQFLDNQACIQVEDINQLATTITDLLNNKDLRDALSSRAVQLMDKQHDIAEQYRARILKYYRDYFLS